MTTSADVDRVLRATVWKRLRERGYERKGRTAYREDDGVVRIVQLRALGRYLAEGSGATSASIHGEVGLFFRVTEAAPWRELPFTPRSGTACAHLRAVLRVPPAHRHPDPKRARPDTWHVGEGDLAPLGEALTRALEDEGLPWLEALAAPEAAMDAFENRPETSLEGRVIGEMYGGNFGSLARTRPLVALAVQVRDLPRARSALVRARTGYSEQRDLLAEIARWEAAVRRH